MSLLNSAGGSAPGTPSPTQMPAPAAPAAAPRRTRPPPLSPQAPSTGRYRHELMSILQGRGFRNLRFRINNYFGYFRRGLALKHLIRGEEPWDEALVDPSKAIVPYGRRSPPADWNDIYDAPAGLDVEDMRAQQATNLIRFGPPRGGFVRPKYSTGDDFVLRLQSRLRRRRLDIRALRHLGAGGHGLATLFEVRVGPRGVARKFVVKSSAIGNDAALQLEKNVQMGLRRAPHIVRALLWGADMLGGFVLTERNRSFCREMDNRKDMLYLEYMKGGNLSDLIGKVVAAGAEVPNGVLWKIFFCLVRACIAMEHVPRLQPQDNNGDQDWYPGLGEDIEERVPDQGDGYGMVHFDLDPKNGEDSSVLRRAVANARYRPAVMIGDYDKDHPAVPVFKVGDWGTAMTRNEADSADRAAVWNNRLSGKWTHSMPEQFHKEWEYVSELPREERPVPKVAGNYGPASNVWAIGLVMHDVIIRHYPPYPPVAVGPMNGPDDTLMPDEIPVFRDFDGNRVDPFYTHGSWLRNQGTIDSDLKGLLMRCLADQPAHRPSLRELNKYLDRAARILAWKDDPDDRDWFEQVVAEPPDANEKVDPALLLPEIGQASGTRQPQQDRPQGAGSSISNLHSAAIATLMGLLSGEGPAQPDGGDNAPDAGPVADDAAWLFDPDERPLALDRVGAVVLLPNPGEGANANPAPDAVKRGADSLPRGTGTPAQAPAGPGGRAGATPPGGPPPFSGLTSGDRRGSIAQSSNAYLSGSDSSNASTVIDSPNIFVTPHDPAALDGNGGQAGFVKSIVLPLSQARGWIAYDLMPIPAFPPGAAPPAPPQGYQYGRASASPPIHGHVVPEGMFTIRIDEADPARGGVPNIFYRDLNPGGRAPRAGDYVEVGGGISGPPPQDDYQGPRAPKVTAMRIPPYGLFERPPPRPQGFHYGRRFYLPPADIQALAEKGIRAPPGRMIIELVHVDPPEGDSYERPTIFYQMEPRGARAPRAPSDDDPFPNTLYATLPLPWSAFRGYTR